MNPALSIVMNAHRHFLTGLEVSTPRPDRKLATELATMVVPENGERRAGLISLLMDSSECPGLLQLPKLKTALNSLRTHPGALRLRWYMDLNVQLAAHGVSPTEELAAYLANVLHHQHKKGLFVPESMMMGPAIQSVDVLRELPQLTGAVQLELLLRSANYFMAHLALCREYLDIRARLEGGCNSDYYEAFARCCFRAARDHEDSASFGVREVCHQLSEHLKLVCSAVSRALGGSVAGIPEEETAQAKANPQPTLVESAVR